MTNKYQKTMPKTSTGPGLAVPDAVTIAMGEIADDMREGLLALAVGAGLQVMAALMEADVAAVCGPRGRHDPGRTAVRHGRERGSVTLGGRRVGVERPRMRAADGAGEVPVPAYELFSRSEILGRMAMGKMLGGLSSRRYTVGLEPVGENVERAASATSKSAVSRRFVAMTETALTDLLAAPLGQLDLVALMIDGVHFGEHLCVVALGIGIDGTKHPLGLVEGSTENTTVVTDLLTDLRGRGLDTTRPILVGIDGGKALHAAVTAVFDHPVIQRCQAHKCRNVANKLPDDLAKTVTKKMRAAYHAPSAIIAEAQLELDGAAGESLSQPSVAVSGTGTTAVSFYRTNPFTGIAVGGGTFGYGLRARPAGGSFGAYRPLSDGQDYPSPQANASQAGFLGDYSSIAASTAPGSDLVHAVWSDTRNISSAGPDEDIFMATVSL